MKSIGIIFSKPIDTIDPLEHIGSKRSVYEDFIQKCKEAGFNMVIASRHEYKGNNTFSSYWDIDSSKNITLQEKEIRLDLAYDRTGGLHFPLKNDPMIVVAPLEFKELSWNKWLMYEELKEYMPKTFYLGDLENLPKFIDKIETELIVIKPIGGLGGRDIYIGTKDEVSKFKPEKENQLFILQEFLDTSNGIEGLTEGKHDLRVTCINKKIIWSHIRIPKEGSYLSNVKHGGELIEINPEKLPDTVRKISEKILRKFYDKYDNPLFSIDFGIDEKGNAIVFEINDQIGFPRESMKNKDTFIEELIENFKSKLSI